MKYAVTVVRTGTIWVEAATPTEAMQIADCQDTEDILWRYEISKLHFGGMKL